MDDPAALESSASGWPPLFTPDGHIRPWADIEHDLLVLALMRNGGCVSKAAAELRIGRTTLYRRLGEPRLRVEPPGLL